MLRAALVLSTFWLVAGCSEKEPGPISRETYIDLYVRILRAAGAARDTAAASDSARRILAERGVTEDDLMAFAQRYIEKPSELANIWEEIESRLKRPPDTTAESGGAG